MVREWLEKTAEFHFENTTGAVLWEKLILLRGFGFMVSNTNIIKKS